MPIVANAQGKRFTFPDGTTQEQMGASIDEFFAQQAPQAAPQVAPQAPPPAPEEPEFNLGDAKLSDIANAFAKLPGAPELAEFAAGVNRSVLGALDFIGPDTVNAALALSGSDARVPTLVGTLGSEGFLEPGLKKDILSKAGEFAPMAVGFGAALRGISSGLPELAKAGESTLAGVTRQLGATTPAQDITGGILAGSGGAVGKEVGGPEGELIGALVAPIAPSAIVSTAKTLITPSAKALLGKAAPTIEGLKDAARTVYKEIDDLGVTLKATKFQDLSNNLARTARNEGAGEGIFPKVDSVLKLFQNRVGTTPTTSEVDTLRRSAQAVAASPDPAEARIGSILVGEVDDFLSSITQSSLASGQGKGIGNKFKDARQLWRRARKSELLADAFKKAELQATGPENGLRVQFRSILNSKKKIKGFSEEEVSVMKQVVKGGTAANMTKLLGKLGVSDQQAVRLLLPGAGAIAGASVLGPAGAVVVPAIGQVSRSLAGRLTTGQAKFADDVVRAGPNGRKVVDAYLKNTPPKARKVEELTELLLRPDVSLKSLVGKKAPESAKRLVNDAVFFTTILKQGEEE